MLKEFKKFIERGNVLDLAVGVIIGAAFGKIVTSLVEDILTPLIGIITGGINFSGLSLTVGNANLMYGNFIQSIIDFLINAFCIFLIVKGINKVSRKKENTEEVEAVVETDETIVLKEIRDLLKEKEAKK